MFLNFQSIRLDSPIGEANNVQEGGRDLIMEELQNSAKNAYSLADAAELLACHKETLRRAIKKGVLKAAKIGRDYRISRQDLEIFYRDQGGGFLFSAHDSN